jgi:hypothetical protein
MRLLVRVIAPLFLTLTFSITVRAATVTNADLPGSIQSCIASATCFVSNTSAYDWGTVNAFQITQNTGSGFEGNWLMRYSLVPPSGQSRLNPPVNDSFSGYLWMLAKDSYSAAETAHPFTLYLDKVSPALFSMFGQSGDLDLFMPTTDMLAGSSYRTYGLDGNNNSYSYGDLSGEVPLPCIAEGCDTHARLNLVQLTYGDFGSVITLTAFNPSDSRGLVFTQSESFPCYGDPSCAMNDVQSFYVSAVPVPGAVWLFGSGLAGLIGMMRRMRQHP